MIHNGKTVIVEQNICLGEYLESCQYDLTKIAVELNGEIIQKGLYEQVRLEQEDVLEVVSFVGGG